MPIEQIHPLVVHFPIVFALSLALFDAIAVRRGSAIGGRSAVANTSAGLAACAGVAAAVAFLFGDMALDVAVAKGTPLSVLETHEELGTATAIVLSIWGALRIALRWRGVELVRSRATAVVIVQIAIALLLVTTAYFGGQLVYEFGVGVNHNSIQ